MNEWNGRQVFFAGLSFAALGVAAFWLATTSSAVFTTVSAVVLVLMVGVYLARRRGI
jgi:hypothetical protein